MLLLGADGSSTPENTVGFAADPFGLTILRPGRGMRASSSAADWAVSNADARPIQPGETLVLAELKGPGTVSHIWNTLSS